MTYLVDSKQYQLVIIDCAYDTWNSKITQELFVKLVALKLKGYLVSYPYGALPIDTTDFVGTHHLICERQNNELVPVMGYKSMHLSRCLIHNLPFPALSLLQAAEAVEHVSVVKHILLQAEKKHHEISYDGSWTMEPELRKDKNKSEYLKEIMTAINVQYHLNYNIPEVVGLGLLRFKTEKYFDRLGYRQIRKSGQVLAPLQLRSLQNEPVVLMHLTQFSDEALAVAEKHRSIWENRIEISDPSASSRLESLKGAA